MAYAPAIDLGTLKHFAMNNTTARLLWNAAAPAAAAWSAERTQCQAFVPIGAKYALVRGYLHVVATATAVVTELDIRFSDNNSNTPAVNTAHPQLACVFGAYAAGAYGSCNKDFLLPLSPTRTFYVYCATRTNVSADWLYLTCLGYAM